MFRNWEKFADIASVTASGTGTADLPVAGCYYALWFRCLDGGAAVSVANIKQNITNLKLALDGVTVMEADAHLLFDLYEQQFAWGGAAQRAGMLPVILAPDWLTRHLEADALAWGMKGIKSFQVEFTFSSLVGTAGHIDQIQCFAERIALDRPLGTHRRLLRYARSFASSGVQELTELPTEGGAGVVTTGYHFQYDGAAAVINNVEMLVNNQVVLNIPPLVAQHRLEKAARLWQVSAAAKDLFSLPFDVTNDLLGYVPHSGLNDLRFRLDWSAAPNAYSVYRESYHNMKAENYR